MITNKYKLHFNDLGYLIGFEAVLDDNYDYVGQMSQFPDVCRGWTKFVNGEFVEDETKKAEIEQKAKDEEEINQLKTYLNQTDYIWNSINEGDATKEDYADVIEKRHQARLRIRELEE